MTSSIIVCDLETVLDISGFAIANDLVGKTEAEIREAIGDKFPKHIYHSIVCIGALVAHREPDHWAVDALGAPHVGERSEKDLIQSFVDKIAELSPQLVTFNGNSFDPPVLRYRAMINEVSAPGSSSRPYFNRYTDDAVDLCDALSSFSSRGKDYAERNEQDYGAVGKTRRHRRQQGGAIFPEGKIKEIADYCETDIVNTYRIWLRYELFRGRLTPLQFQFSEQKLGEFIKARRNTKPHLNGIVGVSIEIGIYHGMTDHKE